MMYSGYQSGSQRKREQDAAFWTEMVDVWADPDLKLAFVRLAALTRSGKESGEYWDLLGFVRERTEALDSRSEEQKAAAEAQRRQDAREQAWGVPAELRGRYAPNDFPPFGLADRSPAALASKTKFYARIAHDRCELARAALQATISAAPVASAPARTPEAVPAPVGQPAPAKPARPPRPTFLRSGSK